MEFKFDLQLFSGEKTEKATPKKLRDARKKGQVVQSKDLNTAFGLLGVFVAMDILGSYFVDNIVAFYHHVLFWEKDIDALYEMSNITILLGETLSFILQMAMPILLVSLVIGVGLSYLQIGVLFTTDTLKFKLEKINPIKGLKRLFSLRSIVELFKSIFKAGLLLYISANYLVKRQYDLVAVMDLDPVTIGAVMWDITYAIVLRCSLALIILAVLDYMYKKWQNGKDQMMSKQEIKEEYKQMEGDPLLKSKIKEKQRMMAMSRMMQDVPDADVVITNPTHFAVGIKYNKERSDAPYVIAKGQDLIAHNIKKIASENEVPIVENKPLARALYAEVDIGGFIPADMYEAVAEVLAYVYRQKK